MAESHNKSKINKYTKYEDEIILKYYSIGGWELVNKYIPNRNKSSIQQRAMKLNVKCVTYNKHYFDTIDSPEKAYWLGFIYADGYVTKDSRFGIELSSKDRAHIEIFLTCLESNIKIKDRTRNENRHSSSFMIKNKHFVDMLIDKGVIPNKTYHLTFPNEKVLPKSLRHHFIRGYFDGDGTFVRKTTKRIRKDRNNKEYDYELTEVSLVCKSLNFISELAATLSEELELDVKIYECKSLYYLRFSNKNNMKKIIEYLYKDTTIHLERKYIKSLELLKYCLA